MKKIALIVINLLIICGMLYGQKSSFNIKAGVTKCIIKKIQEPPNQMAVISPMSSRIGMQIGGRYSYKLFKYLGVGSELQYLLKGFSINGPMLTVFSEHYLGLEPYINVHPFANSTNKFISGISPEIGFDVNYCIKKEKRWDSLSNYKTYSWEFGYTMKLTYQPDKYGIQIYYFKPLTPFFKIHGSFNNFDEYRYSFVTGISFLYKLF
jgi:hypothetical protein